MRKSTKKQRSQVKTIQRTVPNRNATQDYGNINDFCQGSRWLCCQCLSTFCYFLRQNKKNAVWKITFVSEHLNTGQSQLTKCFALVACLACCSLDDSS